MNISYLHKKYCVDTMKERYAYEYKELMDFYPPNEITYNSISKHINQLSPFVGAGLSAFAYPTWQKLFSTIKNVMPAGEHRDKVENAILNDDFFAAGDIVFECLQAPTFLALIQDVFDPRKIQDNELKEEAAFLIPEIFQGLCFTTNFDKVLEKSYFDSRIAYNIATPKDIKLISDSIKDNKNVIFKIHGDIDSNPEQIVLTGASYKKHYASNSLLSKQLSFGMKARRLIFLGASLKKDRTLDMLKKSIVQGDVNFAIVGVESRNQIIERNKELADLRISAMFYPINSSYKHKWVRIILEWLRDGFSPSKEDVNNIIENDRYYKYSCEYRTTSYIYPENVYSDFMSFLNSDSSFSWWEIASRSGGGKSRFAIEIEELISKGNWKVKKFGIANFSSIYFDNNQMEENTLYVFDDSDFYNTSFGSSNKPQQCIDVPRFIRWLKLLLEKCSCNKRLRIIFLFNSLATTVSNSSELLWWRSVPETFNPMYINQYRDDFLNIDICLDDLIEIMEDYSSKRYDKLMPQEFLNEIRLWFSNTDDATLRIPLVAMLCVDAYFSQEPLEIFEESVYRRLTHVEHLRVLGTMRLNIGEYIKNIQAISESFYNYGHINENVLHSNNEVLATTQVLESSDNTEKINCIGENPMDNIEKSS